MRYLCSEISFFTASTTRHPDLNLKFQAYPITVRKRTLSLADPSHVTYDIDLGDLYPASTLKAAVMHPKGDPQANRAAFKRCVEELASEPELDMSEKDA